MELRLDQLVVLRGTVGPVMRITTLERLRNGLVRVTAEYLDDDDGLDDPYGDRFVVRRFMSHRLEFAPDGARMTGFDDVTTFAGVIDGERIEQVETEASESLSRLAPSQFKGGLH